MIIRPATQSDDLVAIWREVYEADHAPLLPKDLAGQFEPRGEAFVAVDDNVIVGFSYVAGDWLDELWVAKAWQGRGVGTALIRHAEDLMRSRGITEASLSVLKVNAKAIALYRRLGWHETKSFVAPNGQPYLKLTRQI